MIASLLCYRKIVESLTDIGFSLNPCDPCVANKFVDGNQMTICFHVDDCKVSHIDPKAVDQIVKCLRSKYESIFEDGSGRMNVKRGKIHNHLGMTLDFTVKGQVSVSMFDCVDDILNTFKSVCSNDRGIKSTAAPKKFVRH